MYKKREEGTTPSAHLRVSQHSPSALLSIPHSLLSSRSLHPYTHLHIRPQLSPHHWDAGLGRILCKIKEEGGRREEEYGKKQRGREREREVRLPVLNIVSFLSL